MVSLIAALIDLTYHACSILAELSEARNSMRILVISQRNGNKIGIGYDIITIVRRVNQTT